MKNMKYMFKKSKLGMIIIFSSFMISLFISLTVNAEQSSLETAEALLSAETNRGDTIVELANFMIQICLFVIGFLTILLAVIAFFGLKSFNNIKKLKKKYNKALDEIKQEKERLQEQVDIINESMKNVVDLTYYHNEGEQAYQEAKYEKSIRYFDDALKIQPENNRILVKKCRALVNLSRNVEAHEILSKLKNEEANDEVWYTLATADRYIKPGEAMEAIEKAISLNPNSYSWWNYKGLLYRDKEEFQSALNCHEKAQGINEEDAVTYFYKALIEYSLKRKDNARTSIQNAKRFADRERHENTIKPIWADTIDYVYYCMQNKCNDANEIKNGMMQKKYSKRNQRAILQHFVFYLIVDRTIKDIQEDLKGFDEDVIEEATKSYSD